MSGPMTDIVNQIKATVEPLDDGLRSSIKQGVRGVNSLLASAENGRDAAVSQFAGVGRSLRTAGSTAADLYQKRYDYGAALVAGAGATAGAIVGLRRGRVSGVLAAGVSGLGVHVGLYGTESLPSMPSMPTMPSSDKKN